MEAVPPGEALSPGVLAPAIAKELGIATDATEAVLRLLADGAHPPFIARYRKERCAELSIETIEAIQASAARAAHFEFRREGLARDLEKRGLVRDDVAQRLRNATDEAALEDIRLHLAKRRRKKAKGIPSELHTVAREVWNQGSTGILADRPEAESAAEPGELVRAALPEAEDFDVLHARLAEVCAEAATRHPDLRAALRRLLHDEGEFVTDVAAKKGKPGRYSDLANARQPIRDLAPPRFLAASRGQREGVVTVTLEVPEARVIEVIQSVLAIEPDRPCGAFLLQAVTDAWNDGLGKAIRAASIASLKQWADAAAIRRYCEMLRPLLLAPPFGRQPVLSIDPGFQHGCRIVVLDAQGAPLADDTVFPLQPKLQAPQARARIGELCREHGVRAIAVGTGSGGRDVERLCRELVRDPEAKLEGVVVASVDADAASLFAASRSAKEAFPKVDAAYRRSVSLGRRLQDPLHELARIDLRKLGLGQYQHEVDQDELRSALGQVLSSSMNWVGVRLNEADADLLLHVAGLSQATAKGIVAFRTEHGDFRTRAQCLDVPGVPGRAFEQAAGFLIIENGEQPLDATPIHPERYGQVLEMVRDQGLTLVDVLGDEEAIARIEGKREQFLGKSSVTGEPLGAATFGDIMDALRHPGRDVRPAFTPVSYHPGLLDFSDLAPGMEVEGIVTHLAPFGVFVDVGINQEGLVHVSEITHGFISNPFEAVHVGQRVQGRVLAIDDERKRFSLSLKALQPRPARPEGETRRKKPSRPRKDRDKGKDKGKDKDAPAKKRPGPKGGDRKPSNRPRQDKVLGFRLDLSDFAKRLERES